MQLYSPHELSQKTKPKHERRRSNKTYYGGYSQLPWKSVSSHIFVEECIRMESCALEF